MTSNASPAAVCIIRVERQPWGMVITVTVNRDIARARAEPASRFLTVSGAVAAITDFLASFDDQSPA